MGSLELVAAVLQQLQMSGKPVGLLELADRFPEGVVADLEGVLAHLVSQGWARRLRSSPPRWAIGRQVCLFGVVPARVGMGRVDEDTVPSQSGQGVPVASVLLRARPGRSRA